MAGGLLPARRKSPLAAAAAVFKPAGIRSLAVRDALVNALAPTGGGGGRGGSTGSRPPPSCWLTPPPASPSCPCCCFGGQRAAACSSRAKRGTDGQNGMRLAGRRMRRADAAAQASVVHMDTSSGTL